MPEKSSEKPESVREIKEEFILLDEAEEGAGDRKAELRLEQSRARNLQEERESIQDLVPGLDLDAFDTCYGKEYRVQQIQSIDLRISILSVQFLDQSGLSEQGVARLNACLRTSNEQYVRAFSTSVSEVGRLMDELNLGTTDRQKVIDAARNFMLVKKDENGIYFEDDDGNVTRL